MCTAIVNCIVSGNMPIAVAGGVRLRLALGDGTNRRMSSTISGHVASMSSILLVVATLIGHIHRMHMCNSHMCSSHMCILFVTWVSHGKLSTCYENLMSYYTTAAISNYFMEAHGHQPTGGQPPPHPPPTPSQGQSSLQPLALAPDLQFFDKLSHLASTLASANANAQQIPNAQVKKEKCLTLVQNAWEGCDRVAELLGVQKKARGKGILASGLLEAMGTGSALRQINDAHIAHMRHAQVCTRESSTTPFHEAIVLLSGT